MNLGLGSVSAYLPTIIKGLGHTNAEAQVRKLPSVTRLLSLPFSSGTLKLPLAFGFLQLYTTPPYAVALVFMLLVTTISDRYQQRALPVMMVFLVGVVGCEFFFPPSSSRSLFIEVDVYLLALVHLSGSLLLGVSPVKASEGALRARYFGCFCVVAAGYTNIPLIISWQAGNTGAQSQRAVSLGSESSDLRLFSSRVGLFQRADPFLSSCFSPPLLPISPSPTSLSPFSYAVLNTVGQCLAILAAFLFPSIQGPRFVKGASINVAFQALGFFITLGMYVFYKTENNRRDKREGGR